MKKIAVRVLILCVIILANVFLLKVRSENEVSVELQIKLVSDIDRVIQVFTSETGEFTEVNSQIVKYEAGDTDTLRFEVPGTSQYIRVDLGDDTGDIEIVSMEICRDAIFLDLVGAYNYTLFSCNMAKYDYDHGAMQISCNGNDPFLIYDISTVGLESMLEEYAAKENLKNKIVLCLALDFGCIICYLHRRKIMMFLCDISGNRGLLFDLAKNDFKTKYAGSYLGIIWAFIQPIVTILVYWFVFQIGFRSGVVDGAPFVLWLTAGLVPWFFFNEALNSATSSLLDYSYLVKKVVFNIEIIPTVRIMSSLFVHVFFCIFMLAMYVLNGIYPCVQWLQLIYYSFCLVLLIIGITYLTSALVVFFRDLAQIIMVVLQVGMWMTPIMWNKEMLSGKLQLIFRLNPLYYIVQGYRDSVIYHKWFWDSEYETIFFWTVTFICLFVGNRMFNRLKIHFADVI